jgi:hypothetical protein
MTQKRFQRAVKIVAVNIILSVVSLIILELIFGNWFNTNRMMRLHIITNAQYRYQNTLYPSDDPIIVYKRDKYGFRGSYDSVSNIDIVTIGGSTTDQRYITEGATWQDILARTFQENGKHVNIVNAGIDGQSSYGHIKDFEWWLSAIPDLKVDYYLFYVGFNDLFIPEELNNDTFIYLNDADTLKNYIKQNSIFYNLYKTLLGMNFASGTLLTRHMRVNFDEYNWVTIPLAHDYSIMMHERLIAYKSRLKVLWESVKQLNGIPICVTQSSWAGHKAGDTVIGIDTLSRYEDKADVNGVDIYYMQQLLNQVTLETCAEAGGISIDLANELQFTQTDFYDFAHNTPQGAEKIGLYLYSKLRHLF